MMVGIKKRDVDIVCSSTYIKEWFYKDEIPIFIKNKHSRKDEGRGSKGGEG